MCRTLRVVWEGFICIHFIAKYAKAWKVHDHHMYMCAITGMGIEKSHEIGKRVTLQTYMRDFNYNLFKIQNLNRH